MPGNKFALEAILSLTDDMTRPYSQTTNKITAMNSGLSRSFGKLSSGITRGLKVMAGVGLAGVTAGVAFATREFIALDDSITAAGAKFKDIDKTDLASFKASLKELSTAARLVGSDTEFSAVDAAGALDKFAMAGMSSVQSMALLRGTTDLATSADTDLTTAVDIATDSLGAFGKMVKDPIELEKNLIQVSDQMAKTTTTANTSLTELFEAVGNGGKTFVNAGQSMASFNALAGILANSSKKGGEAGTNLRNIMLMLSKPTKEAQDALDKLNIVTADSSGNFLDIVDIIAQFEKGLKGLGTQQSSAMLKTIFGKQTVDAFNIVLAEGSGKLREYRQEIENSSGASAEMAEAMRTSLGNRIKVIKSGLTELGLQFTESFEIDGRNALDVLIEGIQNFDMQPIIDQTQEFVEIIKGINMGPIIEIFKGLGKAYDKVQGISTKIYEAGPFSEKSIASMNESLSFMESQKELPYRERRRSFREFVNQSEREPLIGRSREERQTEVKAREMKIRRYNLQEAEKQKYRAMEYQAQRYMARHDVYLNAPPGYTMASTPGGVPETAVSLGEQ
jgi:TP901 family phage tail tape measure protein